MLDRDGVINEDSANFIRSPDDWHPLSGSLEAIARLKTLGVAVGVCTNQSGIGRGLFGERDLRAIHEKMVAALRVLGAELDCLEICPHHPDAGCRCRKPAPGMLLTACRTCAVSVTHTTFVGDAPRDLQAARAAGCTPVLVLTGKGADTVHDHAALDVPRFEDLAAFADDFIERNA